MARILTTTLATALMTVSTFAFAQNMAAPTAPASTPPAAPAPAAPTPPAAAPAPADTPAPAPADSAAAPDSSAPSDATKASAEKAKMKHHHAMHAKSEGKQTSREMEETEALNKLESNGYNDFKQVDAEKGGTVKATVMKDGKEEQVSVTKSGEIQGGSPSSDSPAAAPPSPPADNMTPPAPPAPPAPPSGEGAPMPPAPPSGQ